MARALRRIAELNTSSKADPSHWLLYHCHLTHQVQGVNVIQKSILSSLIFPTKREYKDLKESFRRRTRPFSVSTNLPTEEIEAIMCISIGISKLSEGDANRTGIGAIMSAMNPSRLLAHAIPRLWNTVRTSCCQYCDALYGAGLQCSFGSWLRTYLHWQTGEMRRLRRNGPQC